MSLSLLNIINTNGKEICSVFSGILVTEFWLRFQLNKTPTETKATLTASSSVLSRNLGRSRRNRPF